MIFRSSTYLRPALLAGLFIAAALALVGCNDYYIPPPPINVILTPQPGLGQIAIPLTLVSKDSSGNLVPGTIQFSAGVFNVKGDASAIWTVDDTAGGNATVGTISSTGLYTAPAQLPNPSTVVIKAAAHQDPTHYATVSVQLQNPVAVISSVSILPSTAAGCPTGTSPLPAAVAGQSYILDIEGSFFLPSSTQVTLSGSQPLVIDTANSSATKLCVPVTVTAPGLLALSVTNPQSAGPGNPASLLSQPASPSASASIATLVGAVGAASGGGIIYGIKAYVPRAAAGTVAVVNPATQTESVAIAMPSGFMPGAAAANPLQNTVAVIDPNGATLAVINASTDTLANPNPYPVAVSGSATFSDGTCKICAVVVDATRNRAVLSTAGGFLTVDLATGAATAPIAGSVSENFAYDPTTQKVYAPTYGTPGGLTVIDLAAGTSQTFAASSGAALGTQVDSAAFDNTTRFGIVADETTSQYTAINFNAATPGPPLTAPTTPFTITTAAKCTSWDAATIETFTHLGVFADQGGCIAVASVAGAPGAGAPGVPTGTRWGQIASWTHAPAPHSLITYVDFGGKTYALALRSDQGVLARIDLAKLSAATPLVGGADSNEVDPSTAIAFTTLQ